MTSMTIILIALLSFILITFIDNKKVMIAFGMSCLFIGIGFYHYIQVNLFSGLAIIIGVGFFVFKNFKDLSMSQQVSMTLLAILSMLSFIYPALDILTGFLIILCIDALMVILTHGNTLGDKSLNFKVFLMGIQLFLTIVMIISFEDNSELFITFFTLNTLLGLGLFNTSIVLDRWFIKDKLIRNLMDFNLFFIKPIIILKLTSEVFSYKELNIGIILFIPIVLVTLFSLLSTRDYGKKQVFYRKIGVVNICILFILMSYLELSSTKLIYQILLANYLIFEMIFSRINFGKAIKKILEKIYHGVPFVPMILVSLVDYDNITNSEKLYFGSIIVFSSLPMIFYAMNRGFSGEEV